MWICSPRASEFRIAYIEDELTEEAREFYCCQENTEEKYEEYLRNINDKFLTCNNILRKKQVSNLGNLGFIEFSVKISCN